MYYSLTGQRRSQNPIFMKITIAADEKAFDDAASWRVIGQILSKPDSVVGLSTGRTTGNMHRLIADIYKRNPFDVSKVTIFGLDEVTNVPREYFGACYTMLKTEIVDSLGIAEENFLMLPTKSDDFEAACVQFTDALQARGGIDLLILGLGENGHLGFNQPGSPFGGSAWVTKMNIEPRGAHTPRDRRDRRARRRHPRHQRHHECPCGWCWWPRATTRHR